MIEKKIMVTYEILPSTLTGIPRCEGKPNQLIDPEIEQACNLTGCENCWKKNNFDVKK